MNNAVNGRVDVQIEKTTDWFENNYHIFRVSETLNLVEPPSLSHFFSNTQMKEELFIN